MAEITARLSFVGQVAYAPGDSKFNLIEHADPSGLVARENL
jgi:hypothetical protein